MPTLTLSEVSAKPGRARNSARPTGFRAASSPRFRVALVGIPNSGKSTLFNSLTALRARTANFPGTTVEWKLGHTQLNETPVELIDLPGLYDLDPVTLEERITRETIQRGLPGRGKPDALLVVADARHLERSLFLASRLLALELPTVLVVNMMDLADARGIRIDRVRLEHELGCAVVPMAACSGRGLAELKVRLSQLLAAPAGPDRALPALPEVGICNGCPFACRYSWSDGICDRSVRRKAAAPFHRFDRLDRFLTHPVAGLLVFAAVMMLFFIAVFWLAAVPMDLIGKGFGVISDLAARALPEGLLSSLLIDGVLGGVGAVLVFLPQIAILFFLLSLLEDSGYLSRAALVIDRYLRKVGLPGMAFVPLLSAHACAIPAVMATRVLEDHRDRLLTILVAPLMSCSARLPVYGMMAFLLFPLQPMRGALVITAAYFIGLVAALGSAWFFRLVLLRGESRPLVLELPEYRLPSLRHAGQNMWERSRIFVFQAGSMILLFSIMMWALATFPRLPPSGQTPGTTDVSALEYSCAGRLGHAIEPVIRPLGYDWQIGVGLISAFAAREIIVSTFAIIQGLEQSKGQAETTLFQKLQQARRDDGRLLFDPATCASLLVFFILAMQCLATLAIVRRETGGWKWPVVQFAYMTALAYAAAFLTYQSAQLFISLWS